MPTHMDRHIPYDQEDPVVRAAHHGFSPFLIVVVVAVVALLVWILIRGVA